MSRTLVVLIILFLTSCHTKNKSETSSQISAATIAASADSAKQVNTALKFLNDYVANCNKMGDAVGVVEWVKANPLATDHLKTELKRMDNEAWKREPIVGLDADPVLDAQAWPDKGFELDSVDRADHLIYVKGRDWKDFKLSIKVIKGNGTWLVDGCGMINIPENKRPKR